MSDTSNLTRLGSGQTRQKYTNPTKRLLEAFKIAQPEIPHVVGLECQHFTTLGPINGQPDFARLQIVYIPDQLCVETKSLREYLTSYRQEHTFNEDLVQTICKDIFDVVKPKLLRIRASYEARGDIAIQPVALLADETLSKAELTKCHELLLQYQAASGENIG